MPERVTSAKSDRVTAVRVLHARPGRRKAGRFVVEGPQGVRSALVAGVVVRDLFMDEEAGVELPDIVATADAAGIPITWTSPEALSAMAETRQPQGVLAVCDLIADGDLDAVMAATGPIVVLDAVTDPGNAGTVIRTADAAGAVGVILTRGCVDVHNGKVVRSTAGSLFHLPVISEVTVEEVVAAASRQGRALAVLAADGDEDLFEAADAALVCPRTCWIVGSEAHGVSSAARAAAHVTVRIPMQGRAESLNAAVAAAVVLYVAEHAFRTRRRGVDSGPDAD